jgi:hypothetical protein
LQQHFKAKIVYLSLKRLRNIAHPRDRSIDRFSKKPLESYAIAELNF